jgi:hypothetical protein
MVSTLNCGGVTSTSASTFSIAARTATLAWRTK